MFQCYSLKSSHPHPLPQSPKDCSIHLCLFCCVAYRIIIAVAAAAKSLQSCPTLCDPIDSSPPGFAVPGILQARTLEWVAISFSNAWKWKVKVKSLGRTKLKKKKKRITQIACGGWWACPLRKTAGVSGSQCPELCWHQEGPSPECLARGLFITNLDLGQWVRGRGEAPLWRRGWPCWKQDKDFSGQKDKMLSGNVTQVFQVRKRRRRWRHVFPFQIPEY